MNATNNCVTLDGKPLRLIETLISRKAIELSEISQV